MALADCTPGRAASLSSTCWKSATRFCAVSYAAAGACISNVSSLRGLKPASTRFKLRKLLIISPAHTSSTKASDTCAMTSAVRVRRPLPPPVAWRPPSLRLSFKSSRDACSAGTSPEINPTTRDASNVNPKTVASILTSCCRGRLVQPTEQPEAQPRQQQTARAAQQRQSHALASQLPDDPHAAGPNRQAHRDLFLPCHSSCQKQIW